MYFCWSLGLVEIGIEFDYGSQFVGKIAVVRKFLLHGGNAVSIERALATQQVDQRIELTLIIASPQFREIVNSLLAVMIFLTHYIISTSDPVLKNVSFFQPSTFTLSLPTCLPILLVKTVTPRPASEKFITFLRIDLLFYYQSPMRRGPNAVSQNCQPDDDSENSLSQHVQSLNMTSFRAKFLCFVEQVNARGSDQQPIKTAPVFDLSNPSIATTKSARKTSKMMKTTGKRNNLTKSKSSKKQGYCLQDGKIYELGEAKNGRMAVLTEIKNTRVRDFSGRGVLVFPTNKKFEGQWVEGVLVGQGKITYPNGDIYVGGTYRYEKHGRGYLYFATGQKYVGEFSGGDIHGEGILYGKKGEVLFDGEWRRGKRRHH